MTKQEPTTIEPVYEAPEDLTAALARFQADRPKIVKDAANPHFKSRYATLDQIESEVLPRLAKLGLAWTVMPGRDDSGALTLTWQLRHTSGQSISGTWPLQPGSPQQVGSQVTYYRRYMLCSVLGVSADDDDDGNEATQAYSLNRAQPAEDWDARVAEAATLTDVAKLRLLHQQCAQRGAPKHVLDEIVRLGRLAGERQQGLAVTEPPAPEPDPDLLAAGWGVAE